MFWFFKCVQAKQLVGSTLLVREEDKPELDEGEFYSRDLVGMRVVLKVCAYYYDVWKISFLVSSNGLFKEVGLKEVFSIYNLEFGIVFGLWYKWQGVIFYGVSKMIFFTCCTHTQTHSLSCLVLYCCVSFHFLFIIFSSSFFFVALERNGFFKSSIVLLLSGN